MTMHGAEALQQMLLLRTMNENTLIRLAIALKLLSDRKPYSIDTLTALS